MTHCSACGRRLREKRYPLGFRSWSVDWLNHARDCARYGMPPDRDRLPASARLVRTLASGNPALQEDRVTHTPQAHEVARATGWDLDEYAAEREWAGVGVGPCGRHRESSALERSNFEVARENLRAIDALEVSHDVASFGHWGVGWIEEMTYDTGKPAIVEAVREMREALDDYPVLDEEHFSELETDETIALIPDLLPMRVRDEEGDTLELRDDLPEDYASQILSELMDMGVNYSPEGLREEHVGDAALALDFYAPEA